MAALDFWYEFASTYSYPTTMRIEALAQAEGVSVRWRPFLLGPIFKAQGWDNSPFNLYPAKGAYMWRDLERLCGDLGVPFELTWSCYWDRDVPCGTCVSCAERREAFASVGMKDPVSYEL